ncbi:uncharacterized protein METZ01_LOCUS409869, partial [marine metagenome]
MFTKDRKYNIAIKWLIRLLLGVSLVYPSGQSILLELGEVDSENQMITVNYDATSDVTGFQFFLLGIDVTNVFGGVSEESNFYIHQGSTCWGRDEDCKDFVT